MKTASANRTLAGVLVLLVVVVLVPAAGVLWFMTAAVRNERAAARETLTAAYRVQLRGIQQQLEATWVQRSSALATLDPVRSPAERFAEVVRREVADSVVLYGDDGRVLYPGDDSPPGPTASVDSRAWTEAQRLEFAASKFGSAARAYGHIARNESDVHLAARALQAQARCLGKAGRKDEAMDILTGTLASRRFSGARDSQGRLIAPDGWLLALSLVDDPADPTRVEAADKLSERLEHYGAPEMPVAQRRFLMRRFQELWPERAPADTLAAEDLAARYLEEGLPAPPGPGIGPSGLDGVWQLAAADGKAVALYHEDTIRADVAPFAETTLPSDPEVVLVSPEAEPTLPPPFLTLATGKSLGGWRLTLHLSDHDAVGSAADARVTAYLWTAGLLIVAVAALAVAIARMIGRQVRLTRLKNDLIATVSHELKTPLASMRLLVDTLLDGEQHDESQVREYLELIAGENLRLSRLIEDFLTFSRMERNKHTFERRRVPPEEITTAAVAAVGARFEHERCRFDVDTASDLPPVLADRDAMTTVVVNLLDNAYKYTKDDKHIVLRTYAENAHVCFAVRDNGIGLSRRSARRVFQRFYQVDQTLSRSAEGVGLGLSIVEFIVNAHGGAVDVASRPGQGSTFTVRLPAPHATLS